MITSTMDGVWLSTLRRIVETGQRSAPRGMPILELDHYAIAVDLTRPVLRVPGRKLNYRFMAAEALWILEGSNRLSDLTPYNPRMADFSDDGATLAGAYGPRIMSQLAFVVDQIVNDPDTRRATLTVWRPNPPPTKDHCCTVAMDFKLRRGALDVHVFMRSSDVWLGLPYDVFSFACVGYAVVNALRAVRSATLSATIPGTLYVTSASSHLYLDQDYSGRVGEVLENVVPATRGPEVPTSLWSDGADAQRNTLRALRDTNRGDSLRWWEDAL